MSIETQPLVRIEHRGQVAIATMDNPKTKNALSPELMQALGDAIENLMASRECRSIVLTGGNGAFCSGGDLTRMVRNRPVLDTRISIGKAHRIVRALVNGEKPVVAAVDGAAFGAGMSLALACDFVVASANSKFAAAFAKVGLAPDSGLYWTLRQRVSLGIAKKLIMTAPTLSAADALELGLADEVVAEGEALSRSVALAEQLAGVAPMSIAVTKAVYADGCLTLEDAFRAERDHHPYLVRSADHLGAVDAFREKRVPEFKGE